MPCYQVITQSVDLSQCGDVSLLNDAFASIDAEGCILVGNRLEGRQRSTVERVADKLKRAYSVKSLYKSAKRQGWAVRKINERKYQIVRS